MAHYIGIAGYSNSGKTTLIAKIVIELQRRGFRAAVMKHDAHGHYKEAEGADSTIFIQAGADAVVTLSPEGVHAYVKTAKPDFKEQLDTLAHFDYVIIEGFKKEKHPKIAVFRTMEQSRIIYELDPPPLAIVTDLDYDAPNFTAFKLNEAKAICEFIICCFDVRQY